MMTIILQGTLMTAIDQHNPRTTLKSRNTEYELKFDIARINVLTLIKLIKKIVIVLSGETFSLINKTYNSIINYSVITTIPIKMK